MKAKGSTEKWEGETSRSAWVRTGAAVSKRKAGKEETGKKRGGGHLCLVA